MSHKKCLSIDIPSAFYDEINMTRCLRPQHRDMITSFVMKEAFSRLVLFGGSRTGQAVRACLGRRFAAFVDSASLATTDSNVADGVLITTAPIHVRQVKKALADSPLAQLPLITLFDNEEINVRLVVESQPRSGTDFTVNNLCRSLDLGYASTYTFAQAEHSRDKLLAYRPGKQNGYVVKSHFTKPLHYPRYRYVPTLFLLGFFPDTYYKWARMLAPAKDRMSFHLTADRPEWQIVQGYIPLHLQWLEYICDKTWIRFEDFYLDFQTVLDTITRLLGEYPEGFCRPNDASRRLYWNEDFSRCFDRVVKSELLNYFSNAIRKFYPEKISLL